MIKELFSVDLSLTGVWQYLKKMHLSHQKACRHYINASIEAIRLYIEFLINQLIALPVGGTLIFIDEFSISTRPSTSYMWGEKGKQPTIPSNEKHRQRTNGFVSVDALTGDIDLWQSPVAKAAQVAEFCLSQAQKAQDKGLSLLKIVLDNNKTHQKKMKAIFEQLKQEAKLTMEVHWIHTASYAPKFNLAEYIITILRKKALHHLQPDFTIEQVFNQLYETIQNETIQSKEQIWNTLNHIYSLAILGNYSIKEL